MIRLSLRSILDHKARFLMTGFAVVLGVSFVVGSLVVTDTVRATFTTLFTEVNEGVDLQVRSEVAFELTEGEEADREPLDAGLVEQLRAVDGVAAAEGVVEGVAQPVDASGEAVTTAGAPLLGFSWGPTDDAYPVDLALGTKPGPGEIAIDQQTFDDHDFSLGDEVEVLVPSGNETFTLVGTVVFGESNSLAGARLTMFEPGDAQRVFDRVGRWDAVQVVTEPGADVAAVRTALAEVLPGGTEVVTGQELADEEIASVDGFIDIFGNVLLGFAAVALFVSSFSIHNTFSIVLGQRVRELALLRAVGASDRQVRRSVLVESAVLGTVASLLGIAGGLATATGLRALMNTAGMGIPADGLVLEPRSIVAGLVVGIGVTVFASVLPARTAARVAPVEALREGLLPAPRATRRRLVAGAAVTTVGAVLFGLGLVAGDTTAMLGGMGAGAVLLFLGIAALSPLFAAPVARLLGAPIARIFGLPGSIARENAVRNPTRTASTASALVIGLALVTTVTVVGTSVKESFAAATEQAVAADFVISEPSWNGFSPELARSLEQAPEFDAVSPVRFGEFRIDGNTREVVAVNADGGDVVDIDVTSGQTISELGAGELMVFEDPARDLGLEPGDTVDVEFTRSGVQTLTVTGIYADATFAGNYVISTETWDANYSDSLDDSVFVRVADGVSAHAASAAITAATADYPQVTVEDRQEFLESQAAMLDQVLVVVNALLLLAVIIAVLGIGNTLALSVFERTRELGLLRAVGMSRRQTRRMVRWEAAIVSSFGAVLGVAVGIGFGVAIASAMPASAVDQIVVPGATLATLIGIAVAAGLLAAILPARRAARLDVLRAISV